MKFNIVTEAIAERIIEVDVKLEVNDDEISLMVDNYYVFTITEKGFGSLNNYIGEDSGLQLDNEGKIILEDE